MLVRAKLSIVVFMAFLALPGTAFLRAFRSRIAVFQECGQNPVRTMTVSTDTTYSELPPCFPPPHSGVYSITGTGCETVTINVTEGARI